MEIKCLLCLVLEIFKTVNNLNPYYMKEIFPKTTNLTHRPLDINFNQNNTTKYGSNMQMQHVLFSKCTNNVKFF